MYQPATDKVTVTMSRADLEHIIVCAKNAVMRGMQDEAGYGFAETAAATDAIREAEQQIRAQV